MYNLKVAYMHEGTCTFMDILLCTSSYDPCSTAGVIFRGAPAVQQEFLKWSRMRDGTMRTQLRYENWDLLLSLSWTGPWPCCLRR